MGLFNKNAYAEMSERQALETKYNSSRANLLIVAAFTLINVILAVTSSGTYFLFSAFIPYFLTDYGMFYTLSYDPDVYVNLGVMPIEVADISLLYILLAITAVIIAFYIISYFASKNSNKAGWLIAALVLFIIDTAVMVYLCSSDLASIILDIVFHAWVIFSLVNGVIAARKLKALPEEEPVEATAEVITEETPETVENNDQAE